MFWERIIEFSVPSWQSNVGSVPARSRFDKFIPVTVSLSTASHSTPSHVHAVTIC